MQKYQDNIAARINGNNLQPLAGAEVRVTSNATGLAASLYQDDELTPITQPLTTDNNGYFAFKAADGEYTLTISQGANSPKFDTITREILLEDPADNPFATLQELALPNATQKIGFGSRTLDARLSASPCLSDFETVAEALAAAAAHKTLNIDADLIIEDGEILDISALSGVRFHGKGEIVCQTPVPAQGQPNAYVKLWGAVGAAVPYASTIAKAAKSFPVANTFAPGDLVLLSNYPTDATDAYTEGAPDAFGEKPRNYADFSPANLRQTRRKELLIVRSSDGVSFTTTTGTVQEYASTQGLQFQKVAAAENVTFDGVTFRNVHVNFRYARGLSLLGITAKSSMIVGRECCYSELHFKEFDAQGTDCRVDFYEKCRNIRFSFAGGDFHSPSDNSILKFLGCDDVQGEATIEGCRNSNAFMVDTAFTENPTGYTDLPSANGNVKITARDCEGQGAGFTCDPYSAKVSNWVIDYSSEDTGLLIKGGENIDVYANTSYADGSGNSIYLYGAVGTNIYGRQKGKVFNATVTNPRDGGQVQTTSGTSQIGSVQTAADQPAFLAQLTAPLSNATGDGTEVVIPFNSEQYDKTSSHAEGIFTATVAGAFAFKSVLKFNDVGSSHTSSLLKLIAGATTYYFQPNPAALADASGNCAIAIAWPDVKMAVGETAKLSIMVSGGTKTISVQGSGLMETFWSGALSN